MVSALVISLLLQAPTPAVVVSVSGNAEMEHGSVRIRLSRFAHVPEGATVITHSHSTASLRLGSGSLVRMGPDTTISLDRLEQGTPAAHRNESITISIGRIWSHVMQLFGGDSSFEVATPNAVAGVRGTAFWVEVTGDNSPSRFVVDEGTIYVRQGDKLVELTGSGATLASSSSGLKRGQRLGTSELSSWRRSLVGGLPATIDELRVFGPPILGDPLRQDIVGPSGIADSVTEATAAGGVNVDVPADLHIELKLR